VEGPPARDPNIANLTKKTEANQAREDNVEVEDVNEEEDVEDNELDMEGRFPMCICDRRTLNNRKPTTDYLQPIIWMIL